MSLKTSLLPLAIAALVCGCGNGDTRDTSGGGITAASPDQQAAAAMAKQPVGKNLPGNTVKLVGDQFKAASWTKAPDYYLVYYSASW